MDLFKKERGRAEARKENLSDQVNTVVCVPSILTSHPAEGSEEGNFEVNVKAMIPLKREKLVLEVEEG